MKNPTKPRYQGATFNKTQLYNVMCKINIHTVSFLNRFDEFYVNLLLFSKLNSFDEFYVYEVYEYLVHSHDPVNYNYHHLSAEEFPPAACMHVKFSKSKAMPEKNLRILQISFHFKYKEEKRLNYSQIL